MKPLILTILLAVNVLFSKAQQTIPDFKANILYTNAIDAVLRKNYKDYDLIIAFRTFSNRTLYTEYNLLVCAKGKWQKQVFKDKIAARIDTANSAFANLPVNNAQCQALFTDLVKSRLFEIEDDKINPYCTERDTIVKGVKRTLTFGTYDGMEVQLWMITPKKSRHLYYYAPDYYVKYCEPKQDRRDLLNIVAMLNKNW